VMMRRAVAAVAAWGTSSVNAVRKSLEGVFSKPQIHCARQRHDAVPGTSSAF
jgi:hypothetical protein